MEAVADDLRTHALVVKHCANHARRAVRHPAHRIVQVCRVGNTDIEGMFGLVIIRVRMGNRDGAKLTSLFNKFIGPFAFRRNIHQLDDAAAAVIEPFKFFPVGIFDVLALLRTLLIDRDIRTFHIDTHNCRAKRAVVHAGFDGRQGVLNLFMGNGHSRRAKTGYPFCHQVRCHFRQARGRGITGIRSHAGVDMNIDKARTPHSP